MKRCDNCKATFLFGGKERDGKLYCSKECVEFAGSPTFCGECSAQSIPVSSGNLVTVNLIGKAFIGSAQKCPTCHSVERYMFFFVGIPLLPLGKWKVKYTQPRRFITRKIMGAQFPDFARQHLASGWNRALPLVILLVLLILAAFVISHV